MSPISPSTRMSGLMAFSFRTASWVWRTFSSKGSAERSKTMESKPAFAASSALAFRHADHDRHAQLARRREDAHENIIVANVEMPHGHFVFLRLLQNLA